MPITETSLRTSQKRATNIPPYLEKEFEQKALIGYKRGLLNTHTHSHTHTHTLTHSHTPHR